jgi:S1-C subfamily serine protease
VDREGRARQALCYCAQNCSSVPYVEGSANRLLALAFAVAVALMAKSSAAQPLATNPPPGKPAGNATPAPISLTSQMPNCETGWVTRVYRDARSSVVRIDSADGLGTGFLFYSPRYVATAFHVVELGRGLTITAADGSQQNAEVVLVDRAHDLAILELEHPIANARPLEPSFDPAPVGTPVLVIGHPFALLDRFNQNLQGLLYWSATQGIVSERSDEFLQVDAAVNPGNSGGPLLGCDGRMLGLVSAKLEAEAIGFAVPAARVTALVREMGHQPRYVGRWSTQWQVDLQLALDPTFTWYGFGLGFNVIAYDRLTTTLRGGLMWASSSVGDGPVLDHSGFRGIFELTEAYRFLLFERPFPFYFNVGAGLAFTIDRINETSLAEQPTSPTCAPANTPQCTQVYASHGHSLDRTLWPMAVASFLVTQSLELSYAFQVNTSSFSDSTHRVLIGIAF